MLKNKKKGFTMIELIVVIVVMSVLLAVLAPSLLRYVESSRMQRDDSAMDEVCNSVQLALADSETFDEVLRYSVPNNYVTYTDSSEFYGQKMVDEEFWAPDGSGHGVTITFNPDENGNYNLAEGVVNNITQGNGSVADSRTFDSSKQCTLGEMEKLYAALKSTIGTTLEEKSSTYNNSSYTVFITFKSIDGVDRPEVYGSFNGTNLSPESAVSPGSGTVTPPEEETPNTPQPETPSGGSPDPTPDYSGSDLGGSGGATGSGGSTPSQPTPPHEHSYTTETTTEATCTDNGVLTSTCSGCGAIDTEVIPALGHEEVADTAVSPTCTAPGKTTGTHCTRCNKVITAQEIIPAKGHTEVTDVAIAATCTEDGATAGSHCSVCNTVVKQPSKITALGHNLNSPTTITAATCTAAGQTKASCQRTGCSYSETSTIPAQGHTEVIDNAVAATCTATGKTAGTHCTRCNKVVKAQEVVPAKGHTEVTDAAIAATCTKTGKTEGTHCDVCGIILVKQQVIPATGNHDDIDNNGQCDSCGNIPTGGTYTAADGTVYDAGDKFPETISDSDVYVYGDYKYTYSTANAGWAARLKGAATGAVGGTAYGELLTYIGGEPLTVMDRTFMGCYALKQSPKIPETVKSMYATYEGCTRMTSTLDIPDGVTNMSHTFQNCASITVAPKIPEGVTNLDYTFGGCNALKTYEGNTAPDGDFSGYAIPETVTSMMSTFAGIGEMVKAPAVPSKVNQLQYTFHGCTKLKVGPDLSKVRSMSIMYYTFANCTSLVDASNIVIPPNTRQMNEVFRGCTALQKAPVIPSSVTNMYLTFRDCTSLTGTLTVNASQSTASCFKNVDFEAQNLTLTGTYESVVDELGATGLNYCSECNGKCYESNGIAFYIDGWECPAEENMSWADWVNSEYNYDDWELSDDGYIGISDTQDGCLIIRIIDASGPVRSTDKIQNGYDYGMQYITPIEFSINHIGTYQAENGMTWGEWVESDYNTDGFTIVNDGENVYLGGGCLLATPTGDRLVYATDIIIADSKYNVAI